jgi:hypothetical protein
MKRPRAKIIVKALIALTATTGLTVAALTVASYPAVAATARFHAVRIPDRLPISDAASSPSGPTRSHRPTPRLAPQNVQPGASDEGR